MNTKSIHLQHIPPEAAEEGLLDAHRREESEHRRLDKPERDVHFHDDFSRSRRSLDSAAS